MKKKWKSSKICLAIVLAITTLFTNLYVAPVTKAEAADLTKSFQFVQNVEILDQNGNDLTTVTDVAKDSQIKLNYTFAIPDGDDATEVKAGDTYLVSIPKEILLTGVSDFNIPVEGSSDSLGTVHVNSDNTATITFSNYAETHSRVMGNFYINTTFDGTKLVDKTKTDIQFPLYGTVSKTITIDFEEDAVPVATVEKTGSYDKTSNTITWTAIINKEGATVKDAEFIDQLGIGLEYVSNSATISGASGGSFYYNPSNGSDGLSGTFGYKFVGSLSQKVTITFKTKVTDTKLWALEGATTYEENMAIFKHDGITVTSNTAKVGVLTDFISKSGQYISSKKQIDWTIKINNNSVAITDATITDNIPKGLDLVPGSVRMDGKVVTDYIYETGTNGSVLKYTYPGKITVVHTLTFSTVVSDSTAYNSNTSKSFTNTASLSSEITILPSNTTSTTTVSVPTSVINKTATSYNAATGIINWKIVVNSNAINIESPTVTDTIQKNQYFIDGSLMVDGKAASESGSYTYSGTSKVSGGELGFVFNSGINSQHTLTYQTRVAWSSIYAVNGTTNISNTATLTGTNIASTKHTGTISVVSEMIKKTGTTYDYKTREITWTIEVNKNQLPLSHVAVTDVIPAGQSFVEGSVYVGTEADSTNYSVKDNKFTYSFPNDFSEKKTITFKTKVTDLSIFESNGSKTFKNTATISGNIGGDFNSTIPNNVSSTGSITVKNTVIGKENTYTKGNSYIDWSLTINSNGIDYGNTAIEDMIQSGLELDTSSVKLYAMVMDSSGNLTKGDLIPLNSSAVKYDKESGKFTFNFEDGISKPYVLNYRTNVTDKTKSPFSNTASFLGARSTETSTVTGIVVSFSGAGGAGTGQTGSLNVYKKDIETEESLSGAVFELQDRYHNVLKTSEPTDSEGTTVFTGLKLDTTYYVREITAPVNYQLSDEVATIKINSNTETNSISYTFYDEKSKGSVTFKKSDSNGKLLSGATYGLYSPEDTEFATPLYTVVTNAEGVGTIDGVVLGNYILREITAPTGYLVSSETFAADILENGQSVDIGTVQDSKITGTITVQKINENKVNLSGAVFGLYQSDGTLVEKATSESDGIATFSGIDYGTYTIKEITAPTGYDLSTQILTAIIDENNETVFAGTIIDKKKSETEADQTTKDPTDTDDTTKDTTKESQVKADVTEKKTSTVASTSKVKTGDTSTVWGFGFAFLGSAAIITAQVIRRKKTQR